MRFQRSCSSCQKSFVLPPPESTFASCIPHGMLRYQSTRLVALIILVCACVLLCNIYLTTSMPDLRDSTKRQRLVVASSPSSSSIITHPPLKRQMSLDSAQQDLSNDTTLVGPIITSLPTLSSLSSSAVVGDEEMKGSHHSISDDARRASHTARTTSSPTHSSQSSDSSSMTMTSSIHQQHHHHQHNTTTSLSLSLNTATADINDNASSLTTLPSPLTPLGARRETDPSHSDDLDPAGLSAVHGQSDSHGQGHLSPSVNQDDGVAAADELVHGRRETGEDGASSLSLSTAAAPHSLTISQHCCSCHIRHAAKQQKGSYASCRYFKGSGIKIDPDCECKGNCPPQQCGLPECMSSKLGAPADGIRRTRSHQRRQPTPPHTRPLHAEVAVLFADLDQTLHRRKVIGDGRCSVASVLLALNIIQEQHEDDKSIQMIDNHRRELGQLMTSVWSEEAWVRMVPNELRGASIEWKAGTMVRRSHEVYHKLLTQGNPKMWLDNCVFYLASVQYSVGIFVLYFTTAISGNQIRCRRIGEENDRHIIIYQSSNHYECIQYNGVHIFPSTHELIIRMIQLSNGYPPQAAIEDDHELWAMREARPASPIRPAAPQPVLPLSGSEQQAHVAAEDQIISKTFTARIDESSTPVHTDQPQTPVKAKRGNVKQRATSAKSRRTLNFTAGPEQDTTETTSAVSSVDSAPVPSAPATHAIYAAPPLVSQVADHGPLYEHVSFRNQPHWRAANEPLWNAYRVASEKREYSRVTPIILDILRLPARMLTKPSRAGKKAKRRTRSAIRKRCMTEAEKLRSRYNSPDPDPGAEQELQLSTDTMTATKSTSAAVATERQQRPRRAASLAAERAIAAAATTEEDESEDDDVSTRSNRLSSSMSGNDTTTEEDEYEHDDPFYSFRRRTGQLASGPDAKVAKRAQYLVDHNLLRKAAQVLHSTARVVDLRSDAAQQEMLRVHPLPPADSTIPTMPTSALPIVLEDDEHLRRLIRRADNGTAAGPSGWTGNMLSSLAQSDICRLGILALLRDVINGELPEEARDMLLASRLVALSKPTGGCRPIAVGEQLYRLAAIIAVNQVSSEAATLLAPHQYGVSVPAGAERILHALQHKLTDKEERLALLQLDISNAFNTCDRARLLQELYAIPALQSIFRIVDFAYARPTALLLQGCNGQAIMSSQGVRQGDPLSALLFCLYMRETLHQVHEKTGVTVYGFFDDINVVGKPRQVMDALSELQTLLPTRSLKLNTNKSHFAYFHDELTPLSEKVRTSLASQNIEYHHDWVGVVGAVVGRDDDAIRRGIRHIMVNNGGHDVFFDRLQQPELSMPTAMLLLRMCMVPSMNYLLRCTAPVCIEDEAVRFDQLMLNAAMDKLGVADKERGESVIARLRSKLKNGGWGLTSAKATSPAAFLGSLAACANEATFARLHTSPIPASSQLHGWSLNH